jgi:hypothetical protein
MTPVILPWRYPCPTVTGVTVTVPHNLLTMKIRAHAPLILTTQGRTSQSMATTRRTNGWRGQKTNALHVSTLQGNYSHRIRRRTTTPNAIFFVFLFHSLRFHPFYYECNPKMKRRQQHLELTSIETRLHAPPLTRDLGSAPFLEKLVTLTTSTSVQDNTNRSNTHWT